MDKSLSVVIKATNDGLGAIDGLLDKLESAGVDTAKLRDEAKQAADALAKVTLEQQALDAFKELGRDTRTLGQELGRATTSIDQLGASQEQARQRTAALTRTEQEQREAVAATKSAIAEMSAELGALRSGSDRAAKATTDYKASVAQAESTIKELRAQLAGQSTELKATVTEKRTAAAAEADLARAMESEIATASRLSAKLGEKRKALDASRTTLKQAGFDTLNLAQAEFQLEKQATTVRNEIVSLSSAVAKAGQEAEAAAGKNEKLLASGDGVSQMARRLATTLAGAFTFREMVQAAADMEKLQVGLEQITGSSAKARVELDFVRRVATQNGADVIKTGEAWLGFQAAIKGTAAEGAIGREVFEAVTVSMGKAGKSSAETNNALLALQQMASKGTVAMEELRGQLGEALPGALQAAAKGMGVTTQDLIKMVESGQVAAQDLFPALTKGLNDLYGGAPKAQTLSQEITNVKNAFVEMSNNIAEAGGLDALKLGAETASAALTVVDAGLVAVGKTIGVVAGAIRNWDFSQLKAAIADIQAEAQDKLVKAAAHNDTLRHALEAVGTEAQKTALATQAQAAAAEKSGQAAAAASPSYAALSSAYNKVKDDLKQQIELADKNVEAVKARGAAAVAEAKLLGDEVKLRAANGKAAADEATALTDLATKRQTEVDVLRAELDNKQALVKASNDNSDQRKKELADLEQLIQKKQVEADTTRAQAAEARANAKAKGEEAQAAAALLSQAQASTTARTAEAKSALSLLETQRELAGQSEQIYRLMGNEEAARAARIQQLEIDIKITRAKAEVARAEAEGSIAVAEATKAELKAKGELTPVKQAELDASIRLAQAKLKEADAIQQSARVTEQAITNLRNFGSESGAAGDRGAAAGDKVRKSWDGVAGSIDRATASLDRYSSKGEKLGDGVTEVGSGGSQFRNKDGYASDASGKATVAGMTEAQLNQYVARTFGEQFIGNQSAIKAANLKMQLDYWASLGITSSPDGSLGDMKNELERLKSELAASSDGSERLVGRSGTEKPAGQGSASAAGGGASYPVHITIGGATSTINTSDRASQDNLQAVLRELADGKARAA